MKSFCWNCFSIIDYGDAVCGHCNARQDSAPGGLRHKLMRALKHPLGEVRKRVISLLGETRVVEAIGELAKVIERDPDPYVAREAVSALGKLGTAEALAAIERALGHESILVRKGALETLSAAGAKHRYATKQHTRGRRPPGACGDGRGRGDNGASPLRRS